ncbi:hypothetical protein CesoFtcFv8_003971 [Champsocephalus esox]|nr:hypothetical protein CesoFtcFv8_003971 [Champsocephalus esox]
MRPLYEALKGKTPVQAIDWTAEADVAFAEVKTALAQAALLAHPSSTAPISITTDASDYAVGAVHEQWVEGAWQPLAFFSRQLTSREHRYSAFDRELLGLYLAVRHFRFMLEGREFTPFVDHKPLTFAMSKVVEPWSARQQRQLSYISEFTTDIKHVFSVRLVAAKFVWHGLKKDVRTWARECVACQRAKVHRHTKAPLERFLVPERRFDHVNIYLVGPLPSSQGFSYLLTMMDRPEAVPLVSTSAADVARAFIATWVCRFGTPSDISSDMGSQFTSELWNAVAGGLGVKLHRTTAYNPQANGLCERFHRFMKASLKAGLTDGNWVDKLPWVMLGLRTAPKEDLQCSTAEMVYVSR